MIFVIFEPFIDFGILTRNEAPASLCSISIQTIQSSKYRYKVTQLELCY